MRLIAAKETGRKNTNICSKYVIQYLTDVLINYAVYIFLYCLSSVLDLCVIWSVSANANHACHCSSPQNEPEVTELFRGAVGDLCEPEVTCTQEVVTSPYRTFDGSCNNLAHPVWGKSWQPQARQLPSQYHDGKHSQEIIGLNTLIKYSLMYIKWFDSSPKTTCIKCKNNSIYK